MKMNGSVKWHLKEHKIKCVRKSISFHYWNNRTMQKLWDNLDEIQ